jgi:hypothetical protein
MASTLTVECALSATTLSTDALAATTTLCAVSAEWATTSQVARSAPSVLSNAKPARTTPALPAKHSTSSTLPKLTVCSASPTSKGVRFALLTAAVSVAMRVTFSLQTRVLTAKPVCLDVFLVRTLPSALCAKTNTT